MIIVRRTAAEPNAALAGVIPEASFARFMASMAAFNKEIVPSRPLDCCDVVFIVETQGSCEKPVRLLSL